ncbi:hypothetical protein [Noviherbaspirillum humi]|nr:hypothetical protein [Noviherbaspirillum humi]
MKRPEGNPANAGKRRIVSFLQQSPGKGGAGPKLEPAQTPSRR